MKYCPACRSQYSDVTLRYCLQDGAILHASDVKQSTIDTVAFSNPATVEKILRTEEMNLFAPPAAHEKTARLSTEPPPKPAGQPPAPKKSGSSGKLWLMAVPALLALVAAGFGGWLYLQKQNRQTARFADPSDAAPPEIARETPPANVSDPASKVVIDELAAPTNSNSQTVSGAGSEEVKKQITAAIELWKKATEARKLPDYLSRYGEKVDYFDKNQASAADIRTEAQKVFEAYNEIEITLTNLRVAVDADGTQATAIFDKEWSYETDKDLIEGKAHTKLRFQKNGADWKIVSEKYQKIYYMEN